MGKFYVLTTIATFEVEEPEFHSVQALYESDVPDPTILFEGRSINTGMLLGVEIQHSQIVGFARELGAASPA